MPLPLADTDLVLPDHLNRLTGRVIGAAMTVHRRLGPGLGEPAYQEAMEIELTHLGLHAEGQVYLPIRYRDQILRSRYRMDLRVEGELAVELKTVDVLSDLHRRQLLGYLHLSGLPLGLAINFRTPLLKDGVARVINDRSAPL